MNLNRRRHVEAFTLGEMLVASAVTIMLFAGMFAASTALNRAYAAADDYFSTHEQQIRIIDYLARDVKRSFSVTTSPDLSTVTCIMPDYLVQSGDPEAVTDATTIGQRRTPRVVGPPYKAVVDYGTRATRTVIDAATTLNSKTLTSATAAFTAADIGNPVSGTTIATGSTISAVTNTTTATLSTNATGTGTGKTLTIYGDGNRTVMDAITSNGSTTLTSNAAYFTAADVGKTIVGTTLVARTKISSITNATTAVLSVAAVNPTITVAGVPTTVSPYTSSVTIGGTVVVYSVNGNSITRTENGTVTTIASATDQLLPKTTDYKLSNTEYTSSNVTFLPILKSGQSAAQQAWARSGTTVYSTAYLRNKRRGN